MKSRFRNWSDARIFLAVIREGSTLAASRKLDMAQPTVARRIDALEHEIGLTLFDRDNRGFRPTEAALVLLPYAEGIERAAMGLEASACDLRAPRPIRITAYSANFSPRVAQIFSEFSAKHPTVRFEFVPGMKPLDLHAGEADIALRLTSTEPDPDLICRHIGTARFTLYGAPEYAARYGLPTSPEDLAGHLFVSFVRDDVPPRFHDWLVRHTSAGRITHTFSEVELVDAAIRSGQALGFINLRLAEPEESEGRLIRCFEPPEELSAQHMILTSQQAYRRPEVREFIRFFAPRYAAIFK